MEQPLWEADLEVPGKNKNENLPCNPALPLQGVLLKELMSGHGRDVTSLCPEATVHNSPETGTTS